MKIDRYKFDLFLAKKCKTKSEVIRDAGISSPTLYKSFSAGVNPAIVGLIARAIDVNVEDIIESTT